MAQKYPSYDTEERRPSLMATDGGSSSKEPGKGGVPRAVSDVNKTSVPRNSKEQTDLFRMFPRVDSYNFQQNVFAIPTVRGEENRRSSYFMPYSYTEHEAVKSKYGLGIRRIASCSSLGDEIKVENVVGIGGIPLKKSLSWSDFGYWCNGNKKFKRSIRLKKTLRYEESCSIFKILSEPEDRDLNERFALAKYLLPMFYPNYWKYLTQKYIIDIKPDIFLDKMDLMSKTIRICKRLLEEEDKYSKFTVKIIGRERRICIKGKVHTINRDFQVAGAFIRDEYPQIFDDWVQKCGFVKLAIEKFSMEMNKLRIINLSIQPMEKLIQLEKKYAKLNESSMNLP